MLYIYIYSENIIHRVKNLNFEIDTLWLQQRSLEILQVTWKTEIVRACDEILSSKILRLLLSYIVSDMHWLVCTCILTATTVLSCRQSEFQCANGHCVALNKVCNVVDDCGDGSDETRPCSREWNFCSPFRVLSLAEGLKRAFNAPTNAYPLWELARKPRRRDLGDRWN